MAKAGISSKWRQLEAAAASRADCLLLKYGCFSAPLPLTPIARHQRIRRFVFGALPIDGGLAVEGDGFVVYVRSKDEDAAMLLTKLEDESDSGRSLPARARFTIAHEIAHTFFFDTRGAQPKSALKAQHRKEVASLERTCNRIAARLLIPDHVLTPIIDNFP